MKRRETFATFFASAVAAAVGMAPAKASSSRKTTSAINHGFHARMVAQPGKGDALVALLFEAPVFEHHDCKVFLVSRSKANPDVVFVTEGWVSEAAHAAFSGTDVAKSYLARFSPLVSEWTVSDEIPLGGKAELG